MTVHPAFPVSATAAGDPAALAVRIVDPLALSDDLAAAWDGLADEASEPIPSSSAGACNPRSTCSTPRARRGW